MEKNVAGKWTVFAYGLPDHANPGEPITGDAANITANIRIDGGAANAVDDTNPTELEDGYYIFDITAVENNGDNLLLAPTSSTANVQVIAVPGAVWTRPPNFNDMGIESDGDLTKCNLVAVTSVNSDLVTAVANRQEMDSNSTKLAAILADTLPLGYLGPEGYGIYLDDSAANTNTVNGTDGIYSNPVSTLGAARTIADSMGIEIYYVLNNSNFTLAATHVDWEFVGFGAMTDNTINLGSQDVSRSRFVNMVLEGTQGGAGRIEAEKCALQDPGAGVSTFHIFALNCGIVDDITLDTSNDNVFIDSYSLVAGTSAPIVRASGAAGTLQMRGQKGGVDLRDLSASHNISLEQVGQVIFHASCNVNANVTLRGIGTITDNTAGMASLTQDAYLNMSKINVEADTALADFFTSSEQLVDDFCDEVISKSAHDVAGSLAKILRQGGDIAQIDGVVSDVSPTPTGFDTNLTQIDDYFNDSLMVFTNGAANAGIGKHVSASLNANGNVAFVPSMAWPVTPDNGDDFTLYAIHAHPISEIQSGLATEAKQDTIGTNVDDLKLGIIFGAAATGTLSTTVATSNLTGYTADQLIGRIITVTSGPAEGESSDIADYASTNGTITFTLMTLAMENGNTFKIT